ncbi:LytTR family DNA-binding domain-containing protein, partial [bacterium]|nr:LytTR family DNA-binding domain-containing protein [bacterium]
LDIQMPKISGFEMLELLDDPPVILFSTAYDQYAMKAFQAHAADYLLKPYSKERFHDAINRALLFVEDKAKNQRVVEDLIAHGDAQEETLERIVVKTGSKISIVPVKKLLWLEAQDDYVMLHTSDGEFLKQKTMKFFEKHLDPNEFVRVHRSYIVKIAAIKQIEQFGKESYKVQMIGGQRLAVSKSGHARLKRLLH